MMTMGNGASHRRMILIGWRSELSARSFVGVHEWEAQVGDGVILLFFGWVDLLCKIAIVVGYV